MKKINFQDLKALIEVFAGSESQRMILSHQSGDQFFWRGPNGFYTNILILFEFYKNYQTGNEAFENGLSSINELLKKISKEEFEKHIISIEKHKDIIFGMLNAIDKLEQEMVHYYSINTLFQFSNITFNSDILFSKIENVFEKNTWNFIPNNAKGDIIEGGKALLFNLPTSASFMFLRALEDCIRKLYKQVSKSDKQVTFGQAIASIEKEITKFEVLHPDFERQIDFLKYIKDEFRNPSAHPDKTFTQKEAEQLFQVINVSIDKIRYLFEKIKK